MNVWETAADLLSRYLADAPRLDALLETLPAQATALERRRCRHLVYGAVRHRALLDHALTKCLRRAPRPRLHAALLIGAFELFEHPENTPAIVHHAVARAREFTSPAEARVVNAVLRRIPELLRPIVESEPRTAEDLSLRFSHPAWLVHRWLARWGDDATRRLLHWNQQPAPVYARALGSFSPPDGFRTTAWTGFYRLDRPDWEIVERLLAQGAIYVQDPATSLAPDLLDVRPGESVLDLCAAPGGKTLQLAERVGASGSVVAVDLPGPRLERLRANLGSQEKRLPVRVLGADVATLTGATLATAGVRPTFEAVLIDVPCSNTGVLRHRVDAKWRITSADLTTLPQQQLAMLRRAAELVRPGGRLVYSTCSLESEENEDVVQRFLESAGTEFLLERAVASLPWESDCDGAGAFLLRRCADS